MAIFINSFWKKDNPDLILDLYPGAILALSVRKLKKDYNGPCLRVRRSSDNLEQDINFVGEELDTASLLSFCGASNGHVVTLYDQSGNGFDFYQSNAARQPVIVSSGVLVVENSKPAIKYSSASNTSLFYDGVIKASPSNYFITVVQKRNFNNSQYLFDTATGRIVLDYNGNTWFSGTGGNTVGTLAAYVGIYHLALFNMKNSTGYFRRNGTTLLSSTPYVQRSIGPGTGVSTTNIGALNSGGNNWVDGCITEFIIWDTDQNSNLVEIESNINTYYTLY